MPFGRHTLISMLLMSCVLLLAPIIVKSGDRPAKATEATYIPCVSQEQTHYVFKVRPVRCGQYPPPGEGFYKANEERRLNWRSWGKYSARAKGLECSFRRPCPNVPAR